ncbi:ankyrin repeat domain-containing protein [Variovorax sp. LT1P1]
MQTAIALQKPDLVDAGLRLGAPLEQRDYKGRTALFALLEATHAFWSGGPDRQVYLRKLLNAGARRDTLDDEGRPLWMAAGTFRDVNLLSELVRDGAPVDGCDEAGQTWLAHAISSPGTPLEAIDLLLRAGADPNGGLRMGAGRTPLACALRFEAFELAALLVEAGAAIDGRDRLGRTVLHSATNTAAVRWLLARGADLEARDARGQTPLLSALAQMPVTPVFTEVATQLCGSGADLGAHAYAEGAATARALAKRAATPCESLLGAIRSVDARSAALDLLGIDESPSKVAPARLIREL